MNNLKIIFFSFVIVISMSAAYPSQSFGENFNLKKDSNGFRGIKWGTNIKDLHGMKYFVTDPSFGGIKKYKRKGERMRIGSAEIDEILYGFWKNMFDSVSIEAKGYSNCHSLQEAIFARFGKGFKENKYIEDYYWVGPYTEILFKNNEIFPSCDAFFSSRAISKKLENYSKNKAKEGAEKDF